MADASRPHGCHLHVVRSTAKRGGEARCRTARLHLRRVRVHRRARGWRAGDLRTVRSDDSSVHPPAMRILQSDGRSGPSPVDRRPRRRLQHVSPHVPPDPGQQSDPAESVRRSLRLIRLSCRPAVAPVRQTALGAVTPPLDDAGTGARCDSRRPQVDVRRRDELVRRDDPDPVDGGRSDPGDRVRRPRLLGLAACLAAWLPARRVASVDPVSALRTE
jgi:hypothetical protein